MVKGEPKKMSYNNLNLEDFKVMLSEFSKLERRDEGREFYVHTGQGGMALFNDAMILEARIKPARSLCNRLLTEDKITEDEHKSLREMINSPDRENLTLAETILEQLNNEQRRVSVPALSPNT